jgi:hypothetical protein
MNFFSDYIKAFKAEWLKLRNSGMFWLVLFMAACIPALFTIAGLVVSQSGIASGTVRMSGNHLCLIVLRVLGFFSILFSLRWL